MTTSKPLISVIMPVYNGGSTIRQAVESVFCQNIPLELLVIDDFRPALALTLRG